MILSSGNSWTNSDEPEKKAAYRGRVGALFPPSPVFSCNCQLDTIPRKGVATRDDLYWISLREYPVEAVVILLVDVGRPSPGTGNTAS